MKLMHGLAWLVHGASLSSRVVLACGKWVLSRCRLDVSMRSHH